MATVNIYKCQWCGKECRRKLYEVAVNTIYGAEVEGVCLFCFGRREWPTYREQAKKKSGNWHGF